MSAVHADRIETVEVPFACARAHAARVEGILASNEMIRRPHSDLEEMLTAQEREWARLMIEENLRLRTQLEQETEVVGVDGQRASRCVIASEISRRCSGGCRCRAMSHARWVERRMERVLSTHAFHVVFTLPSELHGLVKANKKVLFDLLFTTALPVRCSSSDVTRDGSLRRKFEGRSGARSTWRRRARSVR